MRDNEILLKVEKAVNGGYGLSRTEDGKVVLIEGAYPGEEVLVRVKREKKDLIFATALRVLKPSPFRREPKCKYFGKCGGCQFMNLNYEEQLKVKESIVREAFRRSFGRDLDIREIVPSDGEYGYRTKIELTAISGRRIKLGMRMKNSHELVPIERCEVAPKRANEVIQTLPDILTALKVPAYNFSRREGVLKHVIIRYAFSTDQTMVIFVTKTESFKWGKLVSKILLRNLPWIHSVIQVMNFRDDVVLRGPYKTLHGEGVITETFDWEEFQIPPTAFFQSNYNVARKLMNAVFDSLNLKGNEVVLDLYSGVGLLSLRISSVAKRVIGVEKSRVAVKAAKANANINGRRNVRFLEGDVLKVLKGYDDKVDVVVLDPPRSGAGKKVMKEIVRLGPRKIVYVSCEPSTLVRDLKVLESTEYSIEFVKPFDMFPQTFHVENMAVLKKVDT